MDPTRNQAPVALRIVRPYPTVDALLAAESNAFTRTGVVLLGAPSRPSGVVLRFEMCLNDGTPVMRGEGRVVGFRPAEPDGESALMLRFTKLDIKSKELLDRAVALREERRSLAPAALPPREPSVPVPPPPPSVAPATDREAVVPEEPVAPPPPVAMAEPTPAPPPDVEPAMDVDELDLKSADESDLTEHAPPVAMLEAAKEKLPIPQPSPGRIPVPHREIPAQPTPPRHAPEHVPMKHPAPEHLPVPQPSPEPKVRADESERRPEQPAEALARVRERQSDQFRPSLDPEQRKSALERLRARKP